MQACVQKTSRKAFGFGLDTFLIKAPGDGVSTARSKGSKWRHHTRRVTFLVERDKEFQGEREQKMSKALPGFSDGKLPGTKQVANKKRRRGRRGRKARRRRWIMR